MVEVHAGSAAGVLVALVYALVVAVLVVRGLRRAGPGRVGPANAVTLVRAGLVAVVTGLVVAGGHGRGTVAVLVGVASVALLLDGVDGRVARRTGTVSDFGARFDMEVDAFLILVLSVAAAPHVGGWVLLAGAARYLLWLAQWHWPWLGGAMPPRRWRKAVAAVQGVVLTAAVSGLLPARLTVTLVAVALGLLAWSFLTQVWWLARRLSAPPRTVAPAAAAVALVVVWLALVLPNQLPLVNPSAFLRLPVELLLVPAVALLLPRRLALVVAAVAGLALGGVLVLKLADLVSFTVLGRSFDVGTAGSELGSGLGVLRDSVGGSTAGLAVLALVCLLAGLVALVVWSTRRLAGFVADHRARCGIPVAALGLAFLLGSGLGVRVAGRPVASSLTATLTRSAVDPLELPPDPYAEVPGDALLRGLRGQDVLVVFVESYGRVAVEGSDVAPAVNATLDQDTTALSRAGFGARSGYLTSSTYGGLSWLAHSTLESGLWVDSQPRYQQLLGSSRLTLASAFARAGWRTTAVIPADAQDWPEGRAFYGWQSLLDQRTLGYAGPSFSYAAMPDQYTLKTFAERDLAPGHPPVMAEIDLVSSHGPWSPLPGLLDWDAIGDGSAYGPMAAAGPAPDRLWRDPARGRAAYGQSIRYSLDSLVSFVQHAHDDHLVMVVLGDHQPSSVVSGNDANRDVPVSIVARDPAVLRAVSGWGWSPGLRPASDAPVWPMDAFRDRFLAAYR